MLKRAQGVDDGFGQLDLTAFPALNELPPAQSHDARFAKDWRDTPLTARANALRAFISDPDAASLERVREETGNAAFIDEVRERKGESVAQRFKAACQDYIPIKNDYDTMVETLSFNALSIADQERTIDEQVAALIDCGFWTVANLHSCFLALQAVGLLEVQRELPAT